ncbi:ABC transporter transmembrane domain-containing protein [uncultured Shimia sp.]|uniref:ABC transporter transmembrane domain-containing protein n=1 Tax=uncultured Shimia sp. TaxID=573152 RepID=UPI00260A175C|nr:ABC transporter transmembrane domain-containing protein [uncultured Shimia sp.]
MLKFYAAIWRVSAGRQVVLIILSLIVAALAAAPLNFQREIVNGLTEATATAEDLIWLCIGMMAVILLSLSLKWLMGFRANILGEDIIRFLRRYIFGAYLRAGAKSEDTGQSAAMIAAEAEELGKFVGSAFSEPVVQLGTLISVIGFIASTQPKLGLIALLIILPQVVIVLYTQSRVNALVSARVKILRRATGHVTGSDARALEEQVLQEFDEIYDTRRRVFHWKLSTKFLLSAINGAGTVAVLMLGSAMVLRDVTDVGTVVAAVMGLSRLQAPTAFLIAFYRQVSATRVKYELLRDAFPEGDRQAVLEKLRNRSG